VITQKKAQKCIEVWRDNPEVFHESLFDNRLWSKQVEIFNAIRDYPKVTVRSGNTVGKSRITAEIALWFLLTYYPSKVITTAPTFMQVEQILWKEIGVLYNKAKVPIGGKLLDTRLDMNDEWFALGISTDEINRFQGFHSANLMVLIDEALGVEPMIWEAVDGLHPKKVLAIGNPLEAVGDFYDTFNSHLWHKIAVSCEECVEWQRVNGVIPGLVTRQWIDERREEWGSKSALFQSRVLGEFPTEGTNLLIQPKWVDDARNRDLELDEDAVRIVASDVATKHGGNYTVVGYRVGDDIQELDILQGVTVTMTAQAIKHKYELKKADSITVDSDGVGCLVKGTEVWTKGGWIKIENITDKDIVYSKDKNNNLITSKVKSIRFIDNVDIIETKNIAFSFSHFIRCKTRKEYPYKLKSWIDIHKKEVIFDNTFKWIKKDKDFILNANIRPMPNGGEYTTTPKIIIKSEYFVKLLAWFISEGNLSDNGNRYDEINISQSSKSEYLQDIKNVISQCGLNYCFYESKTGEGKFRVFNKKLYQWLKDNCYIGGKTASFKKIPDYVKELSPKTIRLFLDEFMKGDGYLHIRQNTYYTSSNTLADDLLELIYKTGRYGNKRKRLLAGSKTKIGDREITRKYDGYSIYEYLNNNISYKGNKKYIYQKGRVWEIKVNSPTTLFFVRFKDNRAFWVFNEGVSDILTSQHLGVNEFHGGYGSKAIDSNRFKNLRTQFYWLMSKKFEKGMYSLKKLPQKQYELLKMQLCCIRAKPPDALGRFQIETKEDLIARGIASPDLADTVMMSEFAFFMNKTADLKPYAYR